ncbi:AmmeMemoRadiSam system radical SAM enzyme [Arcobacter sp. FWKO B]|uniref:AmmeMemoRadiSam system radical SAM enzyme n=1 Tax=Arcobacter sp. FWKO B TaxID=2593672 RepID=UPI0018A39C7F|nr:AmmeMemoRadiSam system radical SAM enzyme [Arcobacter sp. FWKO B]QOG12056.1 AmmeMemoRadiSam system radical SAM enzyme [Arcobacter sp. FWKO B]
MRYFKQKENSNKLVCLLCSHYCSLSKGQSGICGVNRSIGDEIVCDVYGYVAAINIDPIEKKPLFHFLPQTKSLSFGTVGCNFRCPFCQNWDISQSHKINKERFISPKEMATLAYENGCQSISYTYNEPTIFYPYAKDCAIEAKKLGLKNVFVTNGFESKEVIDDMIGIIDAANIDLKCFNKEYYKKVLFGDLDIILENLKRFVKNGIWVEVTTLIIPTKNDSDKELTQIATFIANELGCDVPWHISAFHPDYKELELERTPKDTLIRAYDIGKQAGLNYVYMGNIIDSTNTKCPNCSEVLLQRVGFSTLIDKVSNSGLCPKCGTPIQGVWE